MNREKIKALLEKYYEGKTSRKEEETLRDYFQQGNFADKFKEHAALFDYSKATQKSSADIDAFAKIDFEESNQPVSNGGSNHSTNIYSWSMRIAAGLILLIVGFGAGQFFSGNDYASNQKVDQLEQEVQQMKRTLMNSGTYQTASAGERLSAVNASTRIADDKTLDQQITDILVYTMNNDRNVNVRLAAAESLFRFRNDPQIRKALVHSLNQQEDPLMQITLINMLVQIKAKGAISEMEKLLVDSETQNIVRQRLEAGIAELKV